VAATLSRWWPALLLGLVGGVLGGVATLAEEEPRYEFTMDWVSDDASVWLEHLKPLQGRPGVRALEIGSFEGRSAIWFLENILTEDSARITCVDTFPEESYEERFDRNIQATGVAHKVEKITGYSQIALRQLPIGSYDFAYVDGCHQATCVISDAVLSFELLKPGGILIFDDYGWGALFKVPPHARPRVAIDAFLAIFRDEIEVLHKDGSLVVVRRKESSTSERGGLLGGLGPAIPLDVAALRPSVRVVSVLQK
jgi:predicted O-methyltransferase YrrM